MSTFGASFVFNSEVLKHLDIYREYNTAGLGEPIKTDEYDSMNGGADITWIVLHTLIFWAILIAFIEYRLCCLCCDSKQKQVTYEDNCAFLDQAANEATKKKPADSEEPSDNAVAIPEEDEEGDSSEVAQIVDAGNKKFKLRFNVKQKPQKQLAYKIDNLSLTVSGGCKREIDVINDLSA